MVNHNIVDLMYHWLFSFATSPCACTPSLVSWTLSLHLLFSVLIIKTRSMRTKIEEEHICACYGLVYNARRWTTKALIGLHGTSCSVREKFERTRGKFDQMRRHKRKYENFGMVLERSLAQPKTQRITQ